MLANTHYIKNLKERKGLMEKEKLKQPYTDATLEILTFSPTDVITTSGRDDGGADWDAWG